MWGKKWKFYWIERMRDVYICINNIHKKSVISLKMDIHLIAVEFTNILLVFERVLIRRKRFSLILNLTVSGFLLLFTFKG